MCRLFGFRSVIPSQVHRSLLDADNALGLQSQQHPDGWGVAYYVDGAPHLTRSPMTAMSDALFHRVSGVVASDTVLAHVRKETHGDHTVLNCHPFQYGRWVFAHNGDIPRFAETRAALLNAVAPRLRRYILGETDSEVIFYLFLSELARHTPLSYRASVDEVVGALAVTTRFVRETCETDDDASRCLLTFLVTDGTTLVGVAGGKALHWSTYKRRCSERDECPHLAPQCEAPTTTGFVNHLILSSEPLSGDNVWEALGEGDVVAADWRMHLTRTHLERRHLPVAG